MQSPPQSPSETTGPRGPALEVQELSKRYDGTLALDRLSFSVAPGEILGLVGPNGAGKTTALRTIVGILPIQSGRVTICGIELARDEAAAKRCLAWVPEEPEPFDTMTVDEHLEFTAALYGVPRWRERADELLRIFELTEKRRALGGELSRGMRQKLAFCQAWLHRPRLLVLDEPLTGLDPRGIRSAKAAIRDLAAEGTAVVLSSHLLELIEAVAQRLLILDRGRRVFVGSMEEARSALAPTPGSSLEEIFFAATAEQRGAEAEATETPR